MSSKELRSVLEDWDVCDSADLISKRIGLIPSLISLVKELLEAHPKTAGDSTINKFHEAVKGFINRLILQVFPRDDVSDEIKEMVLEFGMELQNN